jgi:hypothetical protein
MQGDLDQSFPQPNDLADMPFEMAQNEIVRIKPEQLSECFPLLQETFRPEELNSLADLQADLSNSDSPLSSQIYIVLARLTRSGSPHCLLNPVVSLIAGCYIALPENRFTGRAIGFIEYLVTNQAFRQQGHASAVLSHFERELLQISKSRHEQLSFILGEIEQNFVDFKVKRGYYHPAGSVYAQPPITFDAETGHPLSPKLPKLLMIKPCCGAVEAELLLASLQKILRTRYVPKGLNAHASRQVMDTIHEQVYIPFANSLRVDHGLVIMN